MTKRIYLFITIILILALLPIKALAVCPVCTIAVGAGVGLSRWLGIDDTITGIWIGGLIVSIILWTLDWLRRKKWTFQGYDVIITVGSYLAIVIPLYFTEIIGHPLNKIWGIDKLILGIFLGSIFFYLGYRLYQELKKRNAGKAYFHFQKVVMPIAPLLILTVIFYFITKK